MTKHKAAIFDMDGLIIDSEPIWEVAEINVFSKLGVPLTRPMTKQTMGFRVDNVVEHWYAQYPWENYNREQVEKDIVKNVTELIELNGESREGIVEILQLFKDNNIPLGLASSSYLSVINAVLKRFNITYFFDVVYSAEEEQYGKPHPGVYITTAKKLGVAPEDCIAFEDSFNGVLSAKSARMKCVAVPDKKLPEDKRFCIADQILPSLLAYKLEQ